MTSTITRTSDSVTTEPQMILGYQAARTSNNVVHTLIGGGIAVTLVPTLPRSGMLELFYASEADAWAALSLHSAADSFTLTDTDVAVVDMLYVLAPGDSGIALDDQTRAQWVVSIPYQEIEP